MLSLRSLETLQLALENINHRRYRVHKQRVFARDGRICAICNTDEGQMHIDHIIPRVNGGDHSLENLRVLCAACNLRKGSRSDRVFLARMATPSASPASLSPTEFKPMLDSPFKNRPNPNQ
jgi:5-methylcytosine-specific restriction endonuclease McrA